MKQNRYVACPSCHAMTPSFETTCDECGAAISDISINDASQAKESVVNQTAYRLPRRSTLIGIWAIALPNVVAGPWFAFLVLKHWGGLAGFIMFWGSLGLTCLWFIILYRVTRNYFFRDQTPE